MLRLFKQDRLNDLRIKYNNLMEQARITKRRGDKRLFRKKLEEAELVAVVMARISMSGV